ncbi:MAG: hypothetical protein PHW02_03035 [bacterium]|nr:hypothetical protein [bacterium]
MNRLFKVLFIASILLSMLSSSKEKSIINESDMKAMLQSQKYIEVDTLEDGSYLVRFMKGEKVVKKLSLKMKFKEYKIDTTSVKVEHSAKINKKIYNIRTIQLVIDSIYLSPSLFTISSDKSKIAIRWENLIKRNYRKVEKIFELDTILYEGDHLIGLRSLSRIEVYNEDGKKQYEIDGMKEGWPELNDCRMDDQLEEFHFKNIEGVKKYGRNTSPYMFLDYIYEDGSAMVSNSQTEGNNVKQIKIFNKEGKVVLSCNARAWFNEKNMLIEGEEMYFAYKGVKKGFLVKISGGKEEKRLEIDEVNTLANMDVMGVGEEIFLVRDKTDNMWEMNSKDIGKEIIYYDKGLNEKSREVVSGENVFRGYTSMLGETIVIYPDKQGVTKWKTDKYKIYYVTKGNIKTEEYGIETYRRDFKRLERTEDGCEIIFGADERYAMDREKKTIEKKK